jgi:hypothetical protein
LCRSRTLNTCSLWRRFLGFHTFRHGATCQKGWIFSYTAVTTSDLTRTVRFNIQQFYNNWHWIRFFAKCLGFPLSVPFIHLPPTLYNVSLPVLQFSPVSTIPPTLHTHSFTYHPRYIIFLPQYFSFPCQYHSTIAPYPFIHLPPTLYNISPPVLQFPLSVPFHQCCILIFIHMLLLPEGRTGEAWEPSIKQRSFGSRRTWDGKVLWLFHKHLVSRACICDVIHGSK